MAKNWFETSAMKDIVHRVRRPDGSVMRELECGHRVLQPAGGKAKTATRAHCDTCAAPHKVINPDATDPSMLLTVGLA